MSERLGDWLQTASGRKFWSLDPRPDEIDIQDIAHALSHQCRFAGHSKSFYSVAEHSVRVAWLLEYDATLALWGLLHDAAEAYLGDLVRPLKRTEYGDAYRGAESRLRDAICERFGLDLPMPIEVDMADECMLATEARDLMGGQSAGKWTLRAEPHPDRIEPWDPGEAKAMFLAVFRQLARANLRAMPS